MNLAAILDGIARRQPDRPALTVYGAPHDVDGPALTYSAFAELIERIAGGIVRAGAAGKRVAIVMDNCWAYLPILVGVWRAGAVAVPINSKLHAKEIAWIIDNSATDLIFASATIADALGTLGTPHPRLVVPQSRDWHTLLSQGDHANVPRAAALDPGGDAWLFYTSGTTGRPKGAVLTHRNLLFACHAYYADIDWVDETDVYLSAAPLSHGAGLYALAHVLRGSHQIVLPHFDPAAVLDLFRQHRNVSMFAAPTMVTRLVRQATTSSVDTRGLKTLIYGGAPMYLADLERALAVFGPKLYQLYGQGEAPMTISGLDKRQHADNGHPRYAERLASAGVARTGCEIRIVDAAGHDVAIGEIGEIITRSDCVMAGYWANPDANARALREGWLWTGDLGQRDADGFLTLKDRSKDLIISGGSNIYPREIEELLLTHPAVLECAVVSRPHPEWGEEVVAYVVARPGADAAAPATLTTTLDDLCLANIARFKRPKTWRIVQNLPKNNYGKVLKTELRQLLMDEGPTD